MTVAEDPKRGTAFVLTAGEYSDYHVIAVYLTEEGAERAAKVIGTAEGDDVQVEPFPLNVIPERRRRWHVQLDLDTGATVWEGKSDNVEWDDVLEHAELVKAHGYQKASVSGSSVRGPDVALRVARDKRTQVLARREGVA